MRTGLYLFLFIVVFGAVFLFKGSRVMVKDTKKLSSSITLPEAEFDSGNSVEKAIKSRRSIRSYEDKKLTLEQVSQLLWAAQGITNPKGLRVAPSAGALYPMEVYVVAGKVKDLDPGIYKYNCDEHSLYLVESGDKRSELSEVAMSQDSVADGMINIVICGVYERTSIKYGSRAERYVHMEAGHIAQNIYLQAVSLGLGTVTVGAFDDEYVREVVGAEHDERPLYIMPIGVI